jgi:dGTPase
MPADLLEKSSFLTRRKYEEKSDDIRNPFQHDRDRIIHSRAFRRLMHKTQIFNANKGDHFRNRLTHTLEVSQIARSIGKRLNLHDELIEAIALGHDLGHTPFGHVGERTLNEILKDGIKDSFDGVGENFKHNFQSLRVVDSLETRYGEHKGLNLTLATREGMLKHTKTKEINYGLAIDLENIDVEKPSFTLEGQVVAIADEIAQYTHDLEDGLRGKVISTEELKEVSLIKKYVFEQFGDSDRSKILENGRLQSLVGVLIDDVVQSSEKLIETYHKENGVPNFSSKTDVYHKCCIVFSEAMKELTDDLDEKKKKLIITSQEISKSDAKAELFIQRIYRAYYKHPRQLPNYILERYFSQKGRTLDRGDLKEAELQHDNVFHRIICDHISGMTDQYAAREYLELYHPEFY